MVDSDGDAHLVYTVSNNWINPVLRQQAEQLGLTRWEATPATAGRGDVGAPGDAEQLMIEAAETNHFRIAAMAVSRIVCADCQEAIRNYADGPIQVVVERIVATAADIALTKDLRTLDDARIALKNEVDLNLGDHKAQKALIEVPSYSGFWGYWSNQLFNKYPPPLTIWDEADLSLLRAKNAINAGQKDLAAFHLTKARRAFHEAFKAYMSWKVGVVGAAKKMQIAIGVVAAATIAAFVAPSIVARAGAGAGSAAGTATTAEQTLIRVVEVIERADRVMASADATVAEMQAAEAEEAELLETMAK